MDSFACETSIYERRLLESDATFQRREDEACKILRTSTNAKDILLICSHFPFRHSDIPLSILSQRWSARLNEVLKFFPSTEHDLRNDYHIDDELKLRKAQEILKRTVADSPNPHIWNWEWNPPVASSTMGPSQIANSVIKEMFTAFSKVSFLALIKEASGLQPKDVKDVLDGVAQTRRELCRWWKELHQSEKVYEAVEAYLKNKCPLAYWAVSTSIWNTDDSPDPSDALASILIPIRELFENQELPLIPMLQRLEILAVLHQDILDGYDPEWEGLLSADFSFLGYFSNRTPQQLAELLTNTDLCEFCHLCPSDFWFTGEEPLPSNLEGIIKKWFSLAKSVKICTIAHPELVGFISETTKVLLDGRNFSSGCALLCGLQEAKQSPANLSKYWELVRPESIYMAYRIHWSTGYGLPWLIPHVTMLRPRPRIYKGMVLFDLYRFVGYTGLLPCIEDNPRKSGSNPTKGETKSGRSCIGLVPGIISSLLLTPFSGMQKYWAGRSCSSAELFEREIQKDIPALSSRVAEDRTQRMEKVELTTRSKATIEPMYQSPLEADSILEEEKEEGLQETALKWDQIKANRKDRERNRLRVENATYTRESVHLGGNAKGESCPPEERK